MMMKLSEIRTKYPQYDDLSDQQLADALHKKYPQLSKTDFYKRIGFKVTTQKEGDKGRLALYPPYSSPAYLFKPSHSKNF